MKREEKLDRVTHVKDKAAVDSVKRHQTWKCSLCFLQIMKYMNTSVTSQKVQEESWTHQMKKKKLLFFKTFSHLEKQVVNNSPKMALMLCIAQLVIVQWCLQHFIVHHGQKLSLVLAVSS